MRPTSSVRLAWTIGLVLVVASTGVVRSRQAAPVADATPAALGSPAASVATPIASPIASPFAAPGCDGGPATPVAPFRTVNQEIAVTVDRLFTCLARQDWAAVAGFTSIAPGGADPFAGLAEIDGTGLLSLRIAVEAQTVRSMGPSGARVDIAWRVGSQLRFERWTFRKTGGVWRVTLVEPGVPLHDGAVVGFTGAVAPGAVTLARSEIVSPGGVEIAFDVAPDVPVGSVLLVFPEEVCARRTPMPLTAALDLTGGRTTLSLDEAPDGRYRLTLVTATGALSPDSICAAPWVALQITT